MKNLNKYLILIKKIIIKHKLFLLLFMFAAVIRFLYLQDNLVPFLFDHGKDSLAVLDMISGPNLKLIGPWTSIPGLYFGPAWYYLLAPFFYISGYNPAFGAVAMTILVLLQMYLVYRYFNIESAAIVGFSEFWLMISKSAWNPFPMTLLTIVIVVLLLKQLKLKKIDNKLLAGLAFTASFGFHFSSAFAIFYPLIIMAVLFSKRLWPNIKNILIAAVAFIFPFSPQILFEIKYDFPQYHAVVNYFTNSSSNDELSKSKLLDIYTRLIGENRNIIFASQPKINSQVLFYLFTFFILFSIFYIKKHKLMNKKLRNLIFISIIFFIIPIIGFLFLHFNLWYIYPLVPVFTILVGSLVHKLPKLFSISFIFIYVLTGFLRLNYFLKVEKPKYITDSGFYPVKRKVIDYIREDAGERDFSVFTYKQDIYDFPYQFEFLAQGLKGKPLPLEFAYEPNVVKYVMEKESLLATIDKKYGQRWRGEPKIIYYIVTDNDGSALLGNWWGRQKYGEIIAEKKFGERLVVYTATPKKD